MKMFKAVTSILFTSIISLSAFAWDNSCMNGGCDVTLVEGCNPFESYCQCTDPICNRPQYSNCISRAYCCEAFGNIGAR